MIDCHRGKGELREMCLGQRRQAGDKRNAYRINAVILLGSGWSSEQVVQVLRSYSDTARSYFKRYERDG